MTRRRDYLAIALGCFLIAGVALAVLVVGCTPLGAPDLARWAQTDFGPPVTLRLCVLLDDGLTEADAVALVEAAWAEEAPTYRVHFIVAAARRWPRPAHGSDAIMAALVREPIADSCDRVLAILRVGVRDVLRTLVWPTVQGASAVTHAYVLEQMPGVLHHELHHLLGCEHALSLAGCYDRIAALKRSRVGDFFPAWSRTVHGIIPTRAGVGRLFSQ